jgi:signal transduction histidine kinase
MHRSAWGSPKAAWRVGLAILVVALLAACPIKGLGAPDVDQALIEITHAEILLGADSAMPPPDSAAWQPVSLPDFWPETRPDASGYAWYRLQVHLPAQPQGRQALYIQRLRHVGACFVNGVEVGQFGEFGSASQGPRPQLFEFSHELLHAGLNTVHVRLWVPFDWDGVLTTVHLGPRKLVQDYSVTDGFWRITAPACAMTVFVFVAFVTLTLWAYRTHGESSYGYFGLAALFRIPFAANDLVSGSPGLAGDAVNTFIDVTLTASVALTCMFALRYGGWRFPRTERWLWAWIGAYAVLEAVGRTIYPADHTLSDALAYGLAASRLLVAIAYSMVFVTVAWNRRSGEAILIAVTVTMSTALATYDEYWRSYGGIIWFPFRLIPFYLIVTWALTRRFARTLDDAENLNANLMARVEAKRQELEANYRRLGELESQQAVVAERARLMRDMHDGIGGQLISTLCLVEAGQASQDKVAAALRECIDDLRLAIDSLEPTDGDLMPVLGNFRYRVEPRLKARGIDLDWQVRDIPQLAYMTPQNVLHVLRILQEALTNVVKHAGARHVRVETHHDAGRVLIDVSDDGKGLGEPGERHEGRGLANMRQRAQAFGAELLIKESSPGTTISIELPLQAAPSALGVLG